MEKRVTHFAPSVLLLLLTLTNYGQVTNNLREFNAKTTSKVKIRAFPAESQSDFLKINFNKAAASTISPLSQTICSGQTITSITAVSPSIGHYTTLDCKQNTTQNPAYINVENSGIYFDASNSGTVPLRINGFRFNLYATTTTTDNIVVHLGIYKTTSQTTAEGNYTIPGNWTKIGNYYPTLPPSNSGNGYSVSVELGDNGFTLLNGQSKGIYIVCESPDGGFKTGYRSLTDTGAPISNSNLTVTHKVRGTGLFMTDDAVRGFYGEVLYHTNTYGYWARLNATNVTGTGTAGATFSNATPFPISGTLTNNTIDLQTTTYMITSYDVNGVENNQQATVDVATSNVSTNVLVNGSTLSAEQSGATYQWFDCNNGNSPISGATNQDFTPTTNGNYGVSITFSPCQTVNSNCVVFLNRNDFSENELSIYPNPNNGRFFINTLYNIDLFVINPLGQIVSSHKINSGNHREIYSGNLSNGIYFIKGTTDDGRTLTKKIRVQN